MVTAHGPGGTVKIGTVPVTGACLMMIATRAPRPRRMLCTAWPWMKRDLRKRGVNAGQMDWPTPASRDPRKHPGDIGAEPPPDPGHVVRHLVGPPLVERLQVRRAEPFLRGLVHLVMPDLRRHRVVHVLDDGLR